MSFSAAMQFQLFEKFTCTNCFQSELKTVWSPILSACMNTTTLGWFILRMQIASSASKYMKDHIIEWQRKICRHDCTLQLYTQLKQCEVINPGFSFCPPRLVPYIGRVGERDGQRVQTKNSWLLSSHLRAILTSHLTSISLQPCQFQNLPSWVSN